VAFFVHCPFKVNSMYSFVILFNHLVSRQGVKKLGLSLEHSYGNIKKYLLHHFQLGVQGLLVHLGELLHMTSGSPRHRFSGLGLSGAAMQSCVNTAGTMGLKSQEMIL